MTWRKAVFEDPRKDSRALNPNILGPIFTPKAIFGRFLVGLGPVRVDFSSVDFGRIFSTVLDPNFHGSFSVGHCSGNCLFHWVFWELAPFFEDSSNSASKCCLSKARLTQMRCWHLRPGCDFGRSFTHHFGVVLDLVFGPRFWTSILEFLRSRICLYMGVFWVGGVGPDVFLTHFWTVLLSLFSGTSKPEHAPCRT